MTRSIFDPGGGETEQSGSAFTGPQAESLSHLPPDSVDGKAAEGDEETPGPFTADRDEAARRLSELSEGGPQQPA